MHSCKLRFELEPAQAQPESDSVMNVWGPHVYVQIRRVVEFASICALADSSRSCGLWLAARARATIFEFRIFRITQPCLFQGRATSLREKGIIIRGRRTKDNSRPRGKKKVSAVEGKSARHLTNAAKQVVHLLMFCLQKIWSLPKFLSGGGSQTGVASDILHQVPNALFFTSSG